MKIQFIVGTHPSESYSTRVAEHAAEELRKQGFDVVVSHHPLHKTALGTLLKKEEFIRENKNNQYHYERRTIHKLVERQKADLVFNFHSTPSEAWEESIYSEGKRHGPYDFLIDPPQKINAGYLREIKFDHTVSRRDLHDRTILYKKNEYLVEVRAFFRDLPTAVIHRLAKAVEANTHSSKRVSIDYLTEGTSLEKTATILGLDPKIIGRAIAKTIQKEIIPKRPTKRIYRRVARRYITKKQWEARNKRRVRMLDLIKKREAAKRRAAYASSALKHRT